MGSAPSRAKRLIVGALFFGATAGAAGCVQLPSTSLLEPPSIDQTSAVARQVQAASTNEADFPSFRDMPRVPQDIRPASAWSRSIYDTLRLRRQNQVLVAVAGPTRTDTLAFVKSGQAYTNPPGSRAAEAAANPDKQTGAFVQGARQRATPPSSSR